MHEPAVLVDEQVAGVERPSDGELGSPAIVTVHGVQSNADELELHARERDWSRACSSRHRFGRVSVLTGPARDALTDLFDTNDPRG